MVRVCHRSSTGSLRRTMGGSHSWLGVDRLAFDSTPAGAAITPLHCLVVARYAVIPGYHHLTGKSVFVAAFFHTMMNLVFQLFPVKGSYLFDPRVTGLILAAVAIVVVIVWGSRTLVRTQSAGNADSQEAVSSADEAHR